MSTLSKAKNGDEEAFSLLIKEYKLYMYKTAKAILKDEDDVCDAVQEALISVYRNLFSLKNEKHLKTWIIRITINKCYDIIHKNNSNNQKITRIQDRFEGNESEEESAVSKTDLERALSLIDNDLKIVTVLYYYNDISVKDIANILEIPVGTVKSKLSRARTKLYDILMQEEVEHNE